MTKKTLKGSIRFARLVQMSNIFSACRVYYLSLAGRFETARVRIKHCDLRIRLNSPDLGVALSNLGEEFSHLGKLLPEGFDGIIIDAGGYIGTAAIKFSQMYPLAKIITIEPSSANFQLLEENTRNFQKIFPVKAALLASNKSDITLSNRGTGHWGYTVVEKPLDNPDAEPMETINSITLSDILSEFGGSEIGILKLDIEGGEKEIFDENSIELRNTYAVIAELHDRIIDGCSLSYERFSKDRHVVTTREDKCISVRRD